MTRRDVLYSVIGHVVFGLFVLLLSPISAGLLGKERPKPLIIPVTLVGPPPGMRAAPRAQTAAVTIPKAAREDKATIKPPEKPGKDKAAKQKADSTKTGKQVAGQQDTTKALAAKDAPERTGELSHTIVDGTAPEGTDEIFGEYVPAAGYGGTDPYFQSLFLAIQRAFRNPVPGYKAVQCVVTFTIMGNGAIKDIKLERSSGIARFDRAAMQAIESIEWGRPFPDQFHEYEGFHIRMPFAYTPR